MKRFFALFAIASVSMFHVACKKEKIQKLCEYELTAITDKSSEKEDEAALAEMLKAVKETARINTCASPTDFSIIPIGSKACGGPVEFIPYNRGIDTNCFYKLVNFYGEQMQKYNTKHGAISDCSVPQMPKGVKCENNKPVLTY
ncbi:MAG: hypothetical protein K2X48_05210 [Chitinophagaceae bacterium]|nr:hypothetical protein [Chitinophagaceae bacterium]